MPRQNVLVLLGLAAMSGAVFAAGSGCNQASGSKGGATGGVSGSGGLGNGGTVGGDAGTTPGAGGSIGTGGVGGGPGGSGGAAGSGGGTNGGTGQPPGTGGKTTTTGGMTGVGGNSATGGSTSPGGTSGTGGTTSTGGATNTGGTTSTGGETGTGGNRDAGRDVRADVGAADGPGPDAVSVGDVDASKKITVWMSGDSTMAGDTCAGGGWGDQFGALFNSNVTVVNRSVAGRSIQTWLYEKNVSSTMDGNGECTLTATTYSTNWIAMLDASTGKKAGDYLFIEFGINDGDSTCPRHVGTALFETYLTTMAKAASDRSAQTVFLTSTSAIACSGATAQANRGFGPETKAAGTADNVPVIDMTVLTAKLYTSLGLCPNSADYTSTTSKVGLFFCNDHTHFEAAGATQIAGVAAQALRDQGIGLAAYLK